jgi:hypothetical protein
VLWDTFLKFLKLVISNNECGYAVLVKIKGILVIDWKVFFLKKEIVYENTYFK